MKTDKVVDWSVKELGENLNKDVKTHSSVNYMRINVTAAATSWSDYPRHIEHVNKDTLLNHKLSMKILATLKLKEDEQGLET